MHLRVEFRIDTNQYNADPHLNGLIFAGALWDLRTDPNVSDAVVEAIVVESLDLIDIWVDFHDAYNAVKAAAISLSHSDYINDINDAFFAHGIIDFLPNAPEVEFDNDMEPYELPFFYLNGLEDYALGYKIYRKLEGSSWSSVASFGQTLWEWEDEEFAMHPQSPYRLYYGFTAYNYAGETDKDEMSYYIWWIEPAKRIPDGVLANLPESYSLDANAPNPFNPTTTLHYALPEASRVTLVIYDIAGREMLRWDQQEAAGFKQLLWNGTNNRGQRVPSGVYIYRLEAVSSESGQRFAQSRKMVLMK